MAYTIGTAALWAYSAEGSGDLYFGKVQEESVSVTPDLQAFSYYGSTSSETEVDDVGGVQKTITVTIEKIGTSTANMATFLTALCGLVNGAQDSEHGYPFTYVSDLFGSIQVKVMKISSLHMSPSELFCSYTIEFIECVL